MCHVVMYVGTTGLEVSGSSKVLVQSGLQKLNIKNFLNPNQLFSKHRTF